MQNANKLSICVPVYNRPDLTLRALKSVLYQTVRPFEVLVLNDCSTENMQEVEELCQASGFSYQSNVKNLGLIENINKTISLARGDFLCVLHNDDLLSPLYVEKCLNFLEKYPDFDIWTTNGCAINSVDKIIAEFRLFNRDTTIKKKEGLKTLYKNGFYAFLSIIGATIYRTSFIKNHLFDSAWGNEADLDNALFFLANCDIKYVDIAIYFARIHKQQESSKLKETEDKLKKYVQNRVNIYKKYQPDFPETDLLGPIYATHIIQLILKRKFTPLKISEVLGLTKLRCYAKMLTVLPLLSLRELKLKIAFVLNKKALEREFCHPLHTNMTKAPVCPRKKVT